MDDTADSEDDLGTLTQTSLVGLDMVSTQPDNLFSLELGAGLTGVQLHVVAHRAGHARGAGARHRRHADAHRPSSSRA